MKIHKMPKNYMICECSCEFEFNCSDLDFEKHNRLDSRLIFKTIDCPYCGLKLDANKAIENPQSQGNSNDEITTQLSNLKLELKIEELQNLIITNIEAMTDKKCANKMREWKKEYDNNISKIMKDCEEYIANRLTKTSE